MNSNYITVIILVGIVALIASMAIKVQNEPVQPAPTPIPSVSMKKTNSVTPTAEIANITPTSSQASPNIPAKTTKAVIKTSKGDIYLTLYLEDALNTVANFAKKAVTGYYKGLLFHRVEDWVIQGGDPLGTGRGGGDMPVEFNSKPFVIGSLGVASRGDGKVQNDSQFFITKTDAAWLNGKYTNFGIVTSGMDVVQKIEIGDKILEILVQ